MGEPQRDTGYTKFQEETSVKDSSLFWSVSRIPFDRFSKVFHGNVAKPWETMENLGKP